MSSDMFKNLFRNATEGDCTAPITGHDVPRYVAGTVFYNGPVGMWDFEKESAKHWFDGQALLQSFKIDAESKLVTFRKRFLKSDAFTKANANGKVIITEYGTPGSTDPDKGFVSRVVSSIIPSEMTDNCACTFYKFGGLLVASTETALLRVVDPDTLATGEKIDMSSLVNIASARALRDSNGDLYNLAGTFTTGIKYHFVKFPKSDETDPNKILASGEILSTIPSRMKTCFSYYHTFGMSDDHLVMVEQPWIVNSVKLLASKIKGISFRECLEWLPDEKNRFHIVKKSNGSAVKTVYLTMEPFFFLNFINIFEDKVSKALIVDLLCYDTPEIISHLSLETLRSNSFPLKDVAKFKRFVLPLLDENQSVKELCQGENLIKDYGAASAVSDGSKILLSPYQPLPEGGCEHPVINEKFRGKRYKFCYVIGWVNSINHGLFANAVTKVNMDTGETVAWRGGEFCHPSEAIFVPDPDSTDQEDSGVILAAVTDVREQEKDFLVFIDARNMTEIGRSSFDTDIAFTSHAFRM